jgi:hypothetical protein
MSSNPLDGGIRPVVVAHGRTQPPTTTRHTNTIMIGPFASRMEGARELFHQQLMFVSAHLVNKSNGRVVANFRTKAEMTDLLIPSDTYLYFIGE